MGRRTSKEQLVSIIGQLRREIPDIVLRTTLITGFPGETKAQHEALMEFADEMEFERLGVFTYSPEEDTPAAGFPGQIPEEVKEDRRAELMELQQEIAFDRAEEMTGREFLVMIEGKVADEDVCGPYLYGCAERGRAYFCQNREGADVRGFCEGYRDRSGGI